jgi:hypothetical protein
MVAVEATLDAVRVEGMRPEGPIVTDRDAPAATVHLTKSPYCSSTLRPRAEVLAGYAHAGLFEIVGTATVPSIRLETVLAKHGLPAIEVKAGDVQTPRRIGAEEETTGM